MINYSQELKTKILAYYEKYYKSCGLKDFQQRAQERLREEEVEEGRMKYLQEILNQNFTNSQKHFIFGAGTAGLAVTLFQEYGCDVYGIEPCREEFEIIQEKCKEAGINPNNFQKEFGEKISFFDNQFDFIHCFTVLEHVQDVEECLKEMIRITKPGGIIYIVTPNYRFPAERHYKMLFPTFLPKFLGYVYLWLRKRPPQFLKTINFLTEKKLNKILARQKGIYWFRIYRPFDKKEGGLKNLFLNFLKLKLFICPNQEIIIQKL